MFITGHLGTSYLIHRLVGVSWPVVALAALFPDLVDKGLKYSGFFATGRHIAHNLFALGLSAVFVWIWLGRKKAGAWLAGYAGHLLADLPFSWAMPWFYPFEFGRWDASVETVFMNFSAGQLLADLSISLLALGLVAGRRWGWFGNPHRAASNLSTDVGSE